MTASAWWFLYHHPQPKEGAWMYVMVQPGEEVLERIRTQVQAASIKNAALVLVGAVDAAGLSTMDMHRRDEVVRYQEPMELMGTGEVINGEVHVHATLGRQGNVAVMGHLHHALVASFFVRVWVVPSWSWEQ